MVIDFDFDKQDAGGAVSIIVWVTYPRLLRGWVYSLK